MSDYIPDDIVVDVLLRLPIDSLFRFRCVSKSWRGLIDSWDFGKIHFRTFSVKKPESGQDLKIVALSDRGMFSALEFDPNNCSVASAKQLNYPPNMANNNQGTHVILQLIGSCNGLFCLSNSNGDILLWNPWIQKHWELPSPPIAYSLGIQVSFRLGFGYVQFSDDYKIVNFLNLSEIFEEERSGHDEVYVYSSKLNAWRRIGEFAWKFPEYQPDPGAFANGALHWIVKKRQWEVNNFIVSFDLKNEEFRQVMVCPRHPQDAFEQHLRILDGNLCVLSYYYFAGRYRIDLSVMMEYGVETSWTKIVSIKMPYGIQSLWSLTPITYLNNGRGELLIQIENDKLVVCDPSTNYMEDVRIVGSAASSLASCVSLVTLVQPCGGGR